MLQKPFLTHLQAPELRMMGYEFLVVTADTYDGRSSSFFGTAVGMNFHEIMLTAAGCDGPMFVEYARFQQLYRQANAFRLLKIHPALLEPTERFREFP